VENPKDTPDKQIPLELKDPTAETVDPEILKNIPPQLRAAIFAQSTVHYSGPLPPASELKKYAEVFPGAPERLFAWVEKQSDHRISIEKEVIFSQQRQSDRGQWMAFIIAIVGLAGSVVVILAGHGIEGTILGGADLLALVCAFLWGKKSQQDDRQSKNESFKPLLPAKPPTS
jgi:uncharacterized membrane protein